MKTSKILQNNTILKHIEGLILGSILVNLSINKYLEINQNNKLIFNRSLNKLNVESIINVFIKFNFINNDIINEKGKFFIKRSSAYGVTVSYMPLFNQMETLLFGNTKNILSRDENNNETHVNRKMNVWGEVEVLINYISKK